MNFEEINGAQFNEGLKVVIYGQEGVGKSTLAASFPGAVFIDCEGSTSRMNVRRLPRPTSWEMLEQETDFILANCMTKGYQTVIIDTFDWAERLALDAICADNNVTGIEGIGYGKGWEYEKEKIGHFLDKTDRLIKAGVNIVLLCHAISRKSTLPEAMEEFDHWELKLGNKTTNIAPLTYSIMHRNSLWKNLAGVLGVDYEMWMDHGAVEVSWYRKLDEIERFVSTDENDTAHDCRGSVISMVSAAGELLTFHCADDNLFL